MIGLPFDPSFLAQSPTPAGTLPASAGNGTSWWLYAFYFLSPFIAPSITVFLGGLWVQRLFVSRANASAFADALVKRTEEILNDSLEYWNIHEPDATQARRAKVLEQKIKGGLRVLGADLRYFKEKYATGEDFETAHGHVFDACTDGSFESSPRTADSSRYLLIVNSVNDLKSKVLQVKL